MKQWTTINVGQAIAFVQTTKVNLLARANSPVNNEPARKYFRRAASKVVFNPSVKQ